MNDIADKIDEAASLIEARGWTRGEYCQGRRLCAVGAIQLAVTGDPEDYTAEVSEVEKVIKSALGLKSLIAWNDRQASKKPVIEAFRKAAELARGQVQS